MNQKILLIEDDTDVRENVAEILGLSEYEVYTAKNGKEGLKMATEVHPDLIICDVMMPEMDGYSVLYNLAKNPEQAHIPFIFLTAKTEREDQRKGMRMGADDYLTKPFDATELLLTVETRLKKNAMIKGKYASNPKGMTDLAKNSGAPAAVEEILAKSKTAPYKKREVIYREGALATHIYYVAKGKVKTIKLHEDGKELIVAIFNSGDFFGYVAPMTETEFCHSAVCLEDSEITSIPVEQFRLLLRTNSAVTTKLIGILAGDVREKEIEMLEIAYGTVRSRVADGLIKIAEKYPDHGSTGIPPTREEIAQFIGIATETLIRTISDFKEEGYVKTNGKFIVPVSEKLKVFKF